MPHQLHLCMTLCLYGYPSCKFYVPFLGPRILCCGPLEWFQGCCCQSVLSLSIILATFGATLGGLYLRTAIGHLSSTCLAVSSPWPGSCVQSCGRVGRLLGGSQLEDLAPVCALLCFSWWLSGTGSPILRTGPFRGCSVDRDM